MWRNLLAIVLVVGLAFAVFKVVRHFMDQATSRPPSIRVTFPKMP